MYQKNVLKRYISLHLFVFLSIPVLTLISLKSYGSSGGSCSELLSKEVQVLIKSKPLPRGFWQNDKNIYLIIRILNTGRDSLFISDLKADSLRDLDSLFLKEFGHTFTGKKISDAIRVYRKLPIWEEGLVEVGHWKNLDEKARALMAEVMLRRKEAGLALNVSFLAKDKSDISASIFKRVYGKNITGEAFRQRVLKKYKTWTEFLEALGLDSDKIAKRTAKITDSEIIKVFTGLKSSGIHFNWNWSSLLQNESVLIETEIKKLIGRRLKLKSVFRSAIERKSWDEWLVDFGLDLRLVRRGNIKIKDEEIILIIKGLLEEGVVPLNSEYVRLDKEVRNIDFIEKTIGIRLSLQRVFHSAVRRFKWDDWLVKAGIDPRSIRKAKNPLTDKEIVLAIKALTSSDYGFSLNTKSMLDNKTEESVKVIQDAIGFSRTAYSLYRTAVDRKLWVVWLSEAGLDVTKIQLRGKIPYGLVNGITKASLRKSESYRDALVGDSVGFVDGANGDSERVKVDDVTPETVLIKKEFDERFSSFADSISEREQRLLEVLIEKIEEGLEVSYLIDEGLHSEGVEYSSLEIVKLFQKIREDKDLISVFID